MSTVTKIDGLDGNKDTRAKFIDAYVYADDGGAVTFSKGDLLAFEFNLGSGYQVTIGSTATDVISYFGYGHVAVKANSSNKYFGFGILVDNPGEIAAGKFEKVSVQVGGLCTFATMESGAAIGEKVCSSTTAGALGTMVGGDVEAPVAQVMVDGTSANATVFLLNPYNL